MNDTIDVRFGSLFPWPFRFIALLVLLVGMSLILERTFLSICFMLFGGFILSGYEGTEINKAEQSYYDYKSFFLIKGGEKKKYGGIEKIFINTSKIKQRLYSAHTSHSSTFENVAFNGFIKFMNGDKILLMQKRNKSELIKGLQKVASFLSVEIEDNTGTGHT